jgi:flavodoxin
MKALVVFYSRTGNTRKLAQAIAKSVDAELEEIIDRVDRRGILGYLRSGIEGWFGGQVAIDAPKRDPALFDIVIIGTPIWRWSVSGPMKQYIESQRSKFRNVAFFCTMGGSGDTRAFRQMQELSGKRPVATIAVRQAVMTQDKFGPLVAAFVSQVKSTNVMA